ncbi:hypothetical protein FAUST_10204 [Fusarium austroamericanum]|uniref:Uncharacterized protein n=1 Tax=Fusarium austroamericanum TaxID=282268 RepID=A0AAN5Z2Q2_FUSAU|nr:hypothetical protein FAUST_10204 [Fusarium austroamericanum]
MSYSSQRYNLNAAAARRRSQSSSRPRDSRCNDQPYKSRSHDEYYCAPEKSAIDIQEIPEQKRRIGLTQIAEAEESARRATEKRLQAGKVVVTRDQVSALNPHEITMPRDKAVLAPKEENMLIPTKFVPIQSALEGGPVRGEEAKMITRPDLTPKGKIPLIRKGPGMSSKRAAEGSRRSKRTAEGRPLIQVVDKSRSALNRGNGPSYPISLNPNTSCDRIASFLAPDKRYAKVLVHWDDGRVQRLDSDIAMEDLIRYAELLEIREIKSVQWAA